MSKYRNLTPEELEPLEAEFIEFLVINGIIAEDWLKIKELEPEKAEGIIASFSDVVFEKILRGCRFIERASKNEYAVICCLTSHFHMVALKADDSRDFTDTEELIACIENIPEDVQIFTSNKVYLETRENEIWKMLNEGFTITDNKIYLNLIDKLPPASA